MPTVCRRASSHHWCNWIGISTWGGCWIFIMDLIMATNILETIVANRGFTRCRCRTSKDISSLVNITIRNGHFYIVLFNFDSLRIAVSWQFLELSPSWSVWSWCNHFWLRSWSFLFGTTLSYRTWLRRWVTISKLVAHCDRKESIISNWSLSWWEGRIISNSVSLIDLCSGNVHGYHLKVGEVVNLHSV
mgnify:CR=1 FL=1